MNYKSQLKGWAVDRAIEMYKAGGITPDVDTVKGVAEKLVEYAYVEEEDLDNAAAYLFDRVRNAPAGQSKIDALIGTLEHIKADRISQGLETMDKEVVQ